MKSLLVYSSKTGNTKKLADAIFENLPGEKEVCAIDDAPTPDGHDLICVAFWFQAGKPDPKSQEYLAKITNQKVILAATHGAAKNSAHAQNGMKFAEGIIPDAQVLATFSCQGEVSPQFMEKAAAKPEPPPWLPDAKTAQGHPDEKDLVALKECLEGLRL
ncbi:MAG: flavodoxin family protein [Desulfobulbaceae bacterium]|uniref:Flavodoxin family protein n=1 Tax=Candidatus Desulfobia pelagia TaxID=2841692 RepID=A0A8J6TFU3_9BACT|nr:flavodoxin family protein [Candidatus Desulfobia pelagia]